MRLSNATFNAIVMRYSDKEGHVRFDDFVACVIKLKTMFGEMTILSILSTLCLLYKITNSLDAVHTVNGGQNLKTYICLVWTCSSLVHQC